MISKENLQLIEQATKELFEKLEFQAEVRAKNQEDGSVEVDVTMDEPSVFIGENGQTLLEIQHLLRCIVRKKIGELSWVLLDINDYKKNRETYLRQLANSTADDVALLRKEKELPAMGASDRRVVHVAISERQDVISESIGEDPERRIVIKPKAS